MPALDFYNLLSECSSVQNFESLVSQKSDFYLTASRMVSYKRVALIVRSFAAMPDKHLVVIGDGPEMDQVRKAATPNVTIMGYQPFDVLKDHMQRAKAFLYAAEEDFGIVVVEAQACGTPVIAYGKGGALETVAPDKTGLFFEEQSEAAILAAVERFESSFAADPVLIRQHAERFSTERFRSEFKAFVDDKVEQFFSYKK
ncbi:D-inositol-3-phosphate glycosyltransferase [Castellaniella defragrans]